MSSNDTDSEEDKKKAMRMNIIYKALENGWSVKKSSNDSRTFEFTKSQSLDNDYKGLVVFSKSNVCEDIQKHLENVKKHEQKHEQRYVKKPEGKRSVSTPIIKKDS